MSISFWEIVAATYSTFQGRDDDVNAASFTVTVLNPDVRQVSMNIIQLILWILLAIIVFFLLFWRIWFLRLPDRKVPKKGIVSPANGKLVRIVPFSKGQVVKVPKGLLGVTKAMTKDVAKEGYLLVIMLTPLHVHYQRASVSGVVEKTEYIKGSMKNAVLGAAQLHAIDNERNAITIRNGNMRFKIIQVAGAAARRIECFVKEGQSVAKGDVIGLINFGSQTILVMPKRKLLVKEGQELIDGETIIA